MTDGERLWTGIALSLFLHFSLTLIHASPQEEAPVFRAVLEMESESTLARGGSLPGTGLQSSAESDREEAESSTASGASTCAISTTWTTPFTPGGSTPATPRS